MSEKSLWQVVELKEVIRDFIVPMRDKPKNFNGDIPWIRIDDFHGKWIATSKSNRFVDQKTVSEMRLKINPPGTVLCSCSATLGVCAITKSPLITNQTFIGLVPSELLDVEFLYYVMSEQASKLQKLSSGTTIAYLPREKFEEFNIKIPTSLKEQQKIAEILTSVDEVVEYTQSQIDKLEDLKKATMNELLTKGIGHTEFKETEIGRIPKSWQVKEVRELGECVRGLTYSPKDLREDGLLVLRSSNIQDGQLSLDDCVYVDIDLDERFLTKENDLLICVRNGSRSLLGKSVLIRKLEKRSTHGAFMTVVRSSYNDFLRYYAQSNNFFKAISLDIGATINSINTGNLLQYKVPFPSEQERNEIVKKLHSIDDSLTSLIKKHKKLKHVKSSLMQDLLTGKVRVKVN